MENKLTAEEMFERNYVRFKGEYFIPRSDFLICMEEFAAQEVAHAASEKDARIKELEGLLKIRTSIAEEAQRQRDEGVRLLQEYGCVKSDREEREWHKRYVDFLKRMTSGKKKNNS